MDLGLTGNTVIVTGAGSNIGRATALAFVQEGANVVVSDLVAKGAQQVVDIANTLGGGRAIAIPADMTKISEVEAMVGKALKEFKRLDVLVSCVGGSKVGSFLEMDPVWWDKMISLNYITQLVAFKVVLPVMLKQKSGNIVAFSSIVARVGDQHEAVYAGAKAAVIDFARSMAQQFAPEGIRINCVAPGLTMPTSQDTLGGKSQWDYEKGTVGTKEEQEQLVKDFIAMTPLRKVAKPTDIANAVLFLASDVVAGHITGVVLGVDGGMCMNW